MTKKEIENLSELDQVRLIKNYPEITDEFSFNVACEYLLHKYEKMIHNHWHILCRQLDNSELVLNAKEEYYADAYAAFFNAIQHIDLNKIYNEDFKIMQMESWYLTNVRNKYVNDIVEKQAKTKSLTSMQDLTDEEGNSVDPDVEIKYWESVGYKDSPETICENKDGERICQEAIDVCMNKWSKTEQYIFEALKRGDSKAQIAEVLGLKLMKVYNTINKMKNDMKKALHYN